jgi:hypothetical protein
MEVSYVQSMGKRNGKEKENNKVLLMEVAVQCGGSQ